MENFSTPRMALLPRATNLLTVAVLAAAPWWSGAQRPVDPATLATQAEAAVNTATAARPQRQPDAAAQAGAAAPWPAQGNTLARDGLQAVGYKPQATR